MRHSKGSPLAGLVLVAAVVAAIAVVLLTACAGTPDGKSGPSFFVTSAGPGQGADLGGLAGADRHCQELASAVGAGGRTWRAYLSQQPAGVASAVDARDRIGKGPWMNVKGVVIAADLEQLHGVNHIDKQTALTERGAIVNGRGDKPNRHDVLTGSLPDGRHIPGAADTTCGNWTSSDAGSAMVGHHDKTGLDDSVAAKSWNSSHKTRGCSAEALQGTGGAGLYYCFAAD